MPRGKETRMLTISGVASMLNLHANTVRRWSDQGVFKTYRIGTRGDRRFMRHDIVKFQKTHKFDNSNTELSEE
jgi:excisionase family DNA binding protein